MFVFISVIPTTLLANEPRVTISKIEKAPIIDGVLDDDIWSEATVIEDFHQRIPVEGGDPSEKTIVRLAYDKDMLYVGARLYERNPDAIIARELREDIVKFNDDAFSILIDTMLDRRNAFAFMVNPLGTKAEGRFEDNSSYRGEWDGIWYAATSRDDQGWSVEFAIPFKSLSLNPDSQVWGMEMERFIRRHNELLLWANHDQDKRSSYVASYGDMEGLKNINQGKGLDIKPQAASRYRHRHDNGDKEFTIKPGVEVIYKVKPSLNASLVVNPDFSNALVDDIKTNLTRFNLFFPEQRDFFVRDAHIFQFGGLSETNGIPFFSRRIGLPFDRENPEPLDLDVGAKLSGRIGRYTLGLLNTQMGSGQGIGSKNLSVARMTRDIQKESRLGAMMTYGNPTSGDDNGLIGADYRYRNSELFGSQVLVADVFMMKSFSEGINNNELAYGATLELPNDKWNLKTSYVEIQDNFNPALGFVNRTGIRKYTGDLRYRVRPKGNKFVRFMNWGFESSFTTTKDNELESANVWLRIFDIEGHMGDQIAFWTNWEHETLFTPFEIQPGIIIPRGDYDFFNVWGKLVTSTHRPVAAEIRSKIGGYYSGNFVDVTAKLLFRPSRHIYITLERRVFDINLPQGDFDIEINRARFDINFTPTLSWSNYLQQESETQVMTLQSQLRWMIVPGNDLTLTLNHDWAGEGGSYKSRKTDFFARLVWTHRF
jgi:hypothetical protein